VFILLDTSGSMDGTKFTPLIIASVASGVIHGIRPDSPIALGSFDRTLRIHSEFTAMLFS
jgi:hypothetical protein